MRPKQYIELEQKSYFGGKAGEGTFQKIISQFPAHKTYVAGFMGLDAIMRYKRPAKFNIGIEINNEVVDIWKNATYNTEDILPSNLTVLEGSFFEVNLPCFYNMDTLLYLDPPYTHAERKSKNRYPFELTYAQQEELLNRIIQFPCMVAISCYDNPLYNRILKEENGWRKISFEVITRGGTMATETLYMNFPAVPPNKLHDKRFLGSDYRKREVTRKRLNTIHRKIAKLNGDELGLLLDELLSKHNTHFELQYRHLHR